MEDLSVSSLRLIGTKSPVRSDQSQFTCARNGEAQNSCNNNGRSTNTLKNI